MLNEIDEKLRAQAEDPDWVRLNLVVALFCKVEAERMIEPGLRLLEGWHALASGSLAWALIGKNASTIAKANKSTLDRLRREIRSAEANELTTFRYQGPEPFAPDYRLFWLVSRKSADPANPRTNLVELTLPVPDTDAGWSIADRLLREMTEWFPFDTGYAGPALVYGDDAAKVEAGHIIGPIALRHPGLDVPNNATTSYFVGRNARGARWLTVLSEDNFRKIDASELGQSEGGVSVQPLRTGVLLRASDLPEIGDVNRGIGVPGLTAVARAIRPITFFGDRNLALLFREDRDLVERWERRFEPGGRAGP